MPIVGSNYLTTADVRRQSNKDDSIADIIEVLALQTSLMEDAPVMEANSGKQHLTTVRTGIPRPTWRKLYAGVFPTKGTTAQVYENAGYMEDWSETDAKLVEGSKNPQKLRLNDAKSHIMGIGLELEHTLFYGDTDVYPERFNGLNVRYSSKSAPGTGGQIIDAGGTGSNNTSIWFVGWGEMASHLIYPEGSEAGIQRDDKGKQTKELNDGSLYDVYREKFGMDVGLVVNDWRTISRIANINVANLRAGGGGAPDILNLMIDAYYALDKPAMPNRNTVIYVPRMMGAALHKQAFSKVSNNLTYDIIDGKPITRFLGHPIRVSDAILETEARIV